jgi:DNA polymerase-3 subunit alpha
VKVEPEGESVKLLAMSAQPIDQVAAEAGAQALRIHVNRPEALGSIAGLLSRVEGRNRAEIRICVADDRGQEIDVALPQPYPMTPQIKGAIKAMQGVVMVEDI